MVGSFDVRCQEKRCSHHAFNPFDIHVLPIGINLPVSEHSTAERRDAAPFFLMKGKGKFLLKLNGLYRNKARQGTFLF